MIAARAIGPIALSLALLAASAVRAEEPAASPDCRYDHAAMLALDYDAFDQQADGWRALANNGCNAEAADLIREWRTTHSNPDPPILYWHEGQARAVAGQTGPAIALFEKSHQRPDVFGWNLYVDGSIAFLRRDREALQAARDELAALPQPDDWPPLGPDGKPAEIAWPMNLDFLDGFLRCWDQPYSAAYGCPKPK